MPVARAPLLQAVLLILCLLVVPFASRAQDPAAPQAPIDDLWQHPEWLHLGHYKAGRWPGTWRSQADDPQFFLAPGGATDPRAELLATVEALHAPADQGDRHAQCRFVARLNWLREHLDLGTLPQPDCAAYREFRAQVQGRSAVLVFPSYYLNSPSSMFGHTLLRLDPATADGGSEYLSFALNFGALVNPDDNGLFYAFKGLAGGYAGQFEVDQYYKKIREYNHGENRDIWEYPLNLSPEEAERLTQHLWELRGVDFSYYFFDENCSYRILEMLDVARPGLGLTSGFPLTAIPIDTVRAVQQAGLIEGRYFRPAQGTLLRQRLAPIPPTLRPWVIELGSAPDRIDDPQLQALEPALRAQIVDAAYRYLRYTQTGVERDPEVAQRSFRLLQILQAHAADLPPLDAQPDPGTAPDRSHGSRRLSAGVWTEDGQSYLTLGLRLSLHSQVENRNGFPTGAQINLGNFDLRVEEDGKLDLNRLDVVDILSLSPRDAFFKPLSWGVTTGIERQWTEGREHRVAQVNGGVGATASLGGDRRLYALATSRLEYNHGFDDPLQPAAGLRTGLLLDAGPVNLHWDLGVDQFANGVLRKRATLQHNLQLGRQHALHLEVLWRDQRPEDRLAFGLRYQFYY